MKRSRKYLAGAGILLLLLSVGLLWRADFHTAPARAEAQGGESKRGRDHRPMDSTGSRPSRTGEGGSAEAKLRSLLEIRKGEIAFIRVSPAMMSQLRSDPEAASHGYSPDDAGQGISMIGRMDRDWIAGKLASMARDEGLIEGQSDTADDSFEWTSPVWKISGETTHFPDEARLRMRMKDGGTEMEMITRAPYGTALLIQSGGPEPDGLLLVIGRDVDAAPEGR